MRVALTATYEGATWRVGIATRDLSREVPLASGRTLREALRQARGVMARLDKVLAAREKACAARRTT